MEVGDVVRFESEDTNITKGEIIDIKEEEVRIEYMAIGYAMGSTIKKPKVTDVPFDQVEVIEE